MKRKKNRVKKNATFNNKTLIIVALLFLAIPFALFLSQNQQELRQNAQQTISATPPFFCEGHCPAGTPSEAPSGTPLTNPSIETPSIETPNVSSAPMTSPCAGDNAIQDARHHSKSGSGGGLLQKFLQFLMQLFQKLIELLGGSTATSQPVANVPSQGDQPAVTSEAPQQVPSSAPATPCNPQPSSSPQTVTQPETVPSDIPSSNPSGTVPSGAPVAATTDTCSGKYKLTNPRGQNFGDPQCNFDKNTLFTQLQQEDASNADIWFNEVVPCESGFNPNAYAPPTTGTPDAGGAWGLFQMGQGKNGALDHGDVVWGSQASNAVNYNKTVLKGSWRYWACAKSHWQ
jgi:hypothetical protein